VEWFFKLQSVETKLSILMLSRFLIDFRAASWGVGNWGSVIFI